MYLHPLAGSEQSAPRPHNAASRLACGPEDVGQRVAVLKQALANVEPALAGRETADGSSWSNDPDQHGRSTAAKSGASACLSGALAEDGLMKRSEGVATRHAMLARALVHDDRGGGG